MNNKPQSIIIAETRAALHRIIHNPDLSISVTEVLLRAALLEATALASRQLEDDIISLKKGEETDGIQSNDV